MPSRQEEDPLPPDHDREPRAAVLDHPSVAAVCRALADHARQTGVPAPPVTVLPAAVRTAAAAAEALGTVPAQIANSLIFVAVGHDGDRTPLLVMASGGARVDTDVLADQVGLAAVERADAAYVREETGFAIGGVAPIAHRTRSGARLQTIVDLDLARFDRIWAAAGHSHTVFPTTYADLLAMTGGIAARVR
jgi:prolyl-tRNA editing enzyme YbaK/EbsC (Cys-tRNA(Pro) deacylase)